MTTVPDLKTIPSVGEIRGMSPVYRHPVVAEPSDIDELDHVSNIVYLRWVQEAATAHSSAIGWDRARYEEDGGIFVVRKHEIVYYTSVQENDAVSCYTWIESWRGASSPRCTLMIRDADQVRVATCITLWAYIDAKTQRLRRLPKAMLDDLETVMSAKSA